MPIPAKPIYYVSTKANWGDAWALHPHMICTKLAMAAMPTIDSASLSWRSGEMQQLDSNTNVTVNALDLVGSYVRIEAAELNIDWVGYIVTEGDSRHADHDVGGERKTFWRDQAFTAVGIEWFLTRVQVSSTAYYDNGGDPEYVQRPVGFNTGFGDGRSTAIAARGNKDTRDDLFAKDPDHAEDWDALQVVDHLLKHHGPVDQGGDFAPLEFATHDSEADDYLKWYKPVVRTEGRTVFDLLNQVIDHQRGLVWWIELDQAVPLANQQFDIKISSSLAASISIPGGGTIPAAVTSLPYNFDQDIHVNQSSTNQDESQRYDRIKYRGARRTTTMTNSVADGNTEKSWKAEVETDYKAAEGVNADKNDRYRRANKFQRVYQAFRIPASWDGKAGDGQGSEKKFVSPLLPPGSTSIIDGEPFNIHGMRLLRTMPIKAGFDYDDATNPVSNLPENTKPENLQPFALAKHDSKFVFLDRSAGHIDETESESKQLKTSAVLTPSPTEPGFTLRVGSNLPHALAKGHFDTGEPAGTASKVTPEIDYEDMLFTICCEWDSYCEGSWPTAVPSAVPVQELVVYVGDRYRLDWLAKHTVYDIDNQGVPQTVTTGGPLQDDRRILEDLARLAFNWYQQPRSTLDISFSNLQQPIELGTLITTIGTPGDPTEQTINATVTQIVHDLENGKTTMTAGYAELDFGGLV